MAIDTTIERRRALAQAGTHASSEFTGHVRNQSFMNVTDGDILTMPGNLAACAGKIIVHDNLNGAQSIMVPAVDAAGNEKVVEFWPSSIARIGFEFKEPAAAGMEPRMTGVQYRNAGDVVDAFVKKATLAEGMEELYGKKIKYTKKDEYQTKRFGSSALRGAFTWTITFVK